MEQSELETLIRLITEKVIANLQAAGQLPDRSSTSARSCSQYENDTLVSEKHLFTAHDISQASRNGVKKIRVAKNAILTPSALDCARSNKIIIERTPT